jgi:hypothetical protein
LVENPPPGTAAGKDGPPGSGVRNAEGRNSKLTHHADFENHITALGICEDKIVQVLEMSALLAGFLELIEAFTNLPSWRTIPVPHGV